jgi:hypothetical protein
MTKVTVRGLALGAAAVVASVCVQVGSSAAAATVTSTEVSGFQNVVSCLSAKLCVLGGYNSHGVGDVMPVRSGKPGKAAVVHGTTAIVAVSCPGSAGCIAIGNPKGGAGLTLVRINKRGVPTGTVRVKVPAGVSLVRIACTSLRSCELAGTDLLKTPELIELGSWNGHAVSLHHVKALAKTSDDAILAIACHGSSCLAVGDASHGTADDAIVVAVHHGRPSRPRRITNESWYAVACPTASSCYADGYGRDGGVIVHLSNGVVKATQKTEADLFGIACHRTSCSAVGEQLPVSAPPTVGYQGVVISLSAGKITGTQSIAKSGGFNSVAQPAGNVFVAVGSSGSARLPSEVSAS